MTWKFPGVLDWFFLLDYIGVGSALLLKKLITDSQSVIINGSDSCRFFILIFFLVENFINFYCSSCWMKNHKKSFYWNNLVLWRVHVQNTDYYFLVGMSKAIYENIIIAVFTPTCICRETQCILGWNFLFKHFSLSSLVLERSERGNENWNLKPTAIGYSLSFNSSQSTAAYMRFFGLITFFFSSF